MPTEILSVPARRVVLVDARADRRQLMRLVVTGDDAHAVLVGEADSKASAVEAVDKGQADVALVDVHMPISEGMATIAALRRTYPAIGIIACSFDLDPATVQQALAQGADSCLAKPVNRNDVHVALGKLPNPEGGRLAPLPVAAAAR